jgi:hypothetical protein
LLFAHSITAPTSQLACILHHRISKTDSPPM